MAKGIEPSTNVEEIIERVRAAKGPVVINDVPLDNVEFFQSRAEGTPRPTEEYAAEMRNGTVFPPLDGVVDAEKKTIFIFDGCTRAEAARMSGATTFALRLRLGTRDDAILGAAAANSTHGARRTNADKRSAVKLIMENPIWAAWSNNKIAAMAKVSPPLVEDVRQELERLAETAEPSVPAEPRKRRAMRNGQEYEITIPARKIEAPASVVSTPDPVNVIVTHVRRAAKPLTQEDRARLAGKLAAMLGA